MMYSIRRSVTPGLKNNRRAFSKVDGFSFDDRESDIVDKQEEIKEIAAYLNLIRKRHDKIKQENLRKKFTLERLRKDYEKALSMSQTSEECCVTFENRIEEIKILLADTQKHYKNEMKDLKSYSHILNRMKKDKIAMELKANKIQKSLKSSKYVLQSEILKSQKVKEAQYQSKMILGDMQKTFSISRKKKDEKLNSLEKELKSREDVAARREDRQKRQFEIAEAAANDDKDSHEVKQRETLLLLKLWFNFLNKRLVSEMKKAVDVEHAFSKIKSATGLSDVIDIVEKFLTREQNYHLLVHAVSKAEKKLIALRIENQTTKEMLENLQFRDSLFKPDSNDVKLSVDKRLSLGRKNYFLSKEKLSDYIKVYDQILNWTERILMVLMIPDNFDLHIGEKVNEAKGNLLDVFNGISEKIGEMTEKLKGQGEHVWEAMRRYSQMKVDEVVAEMSTDEALAKIVRVRLESPRSDDEDLETGNDFKETRKVKRDTTLKEENFIGFHRK